MRVSVVMATYQGERYVAHQLDSILGGTRPPDQLVIVDDNSSDGTMAILEQYTHGPWGERIEIYRNEANLGAALSFTDAIDRSDGDVILFADQDDEWMPDKIARMVEVFTEYPETVLAYHDGVICNASLEPDGRTIFDTRQRADLVGGADRDPMEIAGNPDVKGCTMALKGEFAREVFRVSDNGFAKYWGHDHWVALFAFGTGRVIALPEHLIMHRFHGSNTSSAVKFNALSLSHWSRYWRAMKQQSTDHFVERYLIALEHFDRSPYGKTNPIRIAVERHLAMARERHALRSLRWPSRAETVLQLYRSGIYRDHYNGLPTALRDLFT